MICELAAKRGSSPLKETNQRPLATPRVNLSLYLVANKPSFPNERIFFSKIKEAVQGGVTCVQLRDHGSNYEDILKTAIHLKQTLKNIPLIINTPRMFEVARSVKAAGVFIEDIRTFPLVNLDQSPHFSVGVSVWSMEDLNVALQHPKIDYLSVKVFSSKQTCQRNEVLWGKDGLKRIREYVNRRIVAVGGLDADSSTDIFRLLHKNDGVAMAGGLMNASSPYWEARKIQSIRQREWLNK